MEFLDLFLIALMPVLKVILVTALGLFLALDEIDLLGPNARHHLNNLVFYVFSPAIIGSSLADTITLESLVNLWFMPVNILLTFAIGSALGWILVKITRTPQHLSGLVIACCSAGNIGNLFLFLFFPSLCEEKNSPLGDSTTCSTYAEAYASLSMAMLSVFLWTYIYIILRVSARDDIEDNDASVSTISIKRPGETSEIFAGNLTEVLLARGVPSSEDYSDQTESSDVRTESRVKVPVLEKIKAFAEQIHLKKILAPSTIAAVIGLIIGTVSPIRKAMIGDSAPLRVIYSSTSLLGQAAIPCITLIVGANLLKGLKIAGVSPLVIAGIIAVKYIVMPPLGVVVVKGAQHFGFVDSNALYLFSLMLQYAVPPAMNIGTITQLVETGQSESSVLMLWTYATAAFFLTLWSAYFMWLVS
ncbi:Auxin efflux carrier family protein [Melia azedarach]|uniref:Auxin efflux carrier family protein n=1 Tax=Melia azedarach TaxID=155640 RepID=A0ACC1YUA7_MELAZ|nr:Auxin efflux carrier family protein [Melia azedarach]